MAVRKLKNYKVTRFMDKTSHYDEDLADYACLFIERSAIQKVHGPESHSS